MLQFSLDDIKGKVINEDTINERRIKLIASPKSPARRDQYGCGMAVIPPGHVHEQHAHPDSEELIFVVQGTGTGVVGGKTISFKPMDFIALDKGESHTFTNTGTQEALFYWIYSPSGPEVRFLDD